MFGAKHTKNLIQGTKRYARVKRRSKIKFDKKFLSEAQRALENGEKNRKSDRDGRVIEISEGGHFVIKRKTSEVLDANSLYAHMRFVSKQKNFSLVPVKSVILNGTANGLPREIAVQRFFKRPSLEELLAYVQFEELKKGRRLLRLSHLKMISSEAKEYCVSLLARNPQITSDLLLRVLDELKSDLRWSHLNKSYRFAPSNYLVFGFDAKRKVPKVGIIDL